MNQSEIRYILQLDDGTLSNATNVLEMMNYHFQSVTGKDMKDSKNMGGSILGDEDEMRISGFMSC